MGTSPRRARTRIVHVAGSGQWGGGERYIELLARRLDPERFETAVVLPEAGVFVDRLERLRVPVRVVDLGRLVSLGSIVRLAATLRALAPDIVQSHGARSNFYARLATALVRGARNVSTVHNSLMDYPVAPLRRRVYRAMDRLTLPLAARVLCVADALGREYRRPVSVIRNGVDLAVFTPDPGRRASARAALGLDGRTVIGFIGRLTVQKDPLAFLRAVAGVRSERPGVAGLIVGDGPLRPELEREAARLGIAEHCVFAGYRPDVAGLLDALDVFVLSSRSEGLPFVVLEAMAMARPVVATAVNGVPEVVGAGTAGIVVPPGDTAAMVRALLDLLGHPDRARAMGDAARALVAERFDLARMIRQTEALYDEVVRP